MNVINTIQGNLAPMTREPVELELANVAKRILREFGERKNHFEMDLFADPVWLILLDLYAHNSTGKSVSVSSLCIASWAPPTTALRWIKLMASRGLIEKFNDPTDGRRVYVNLSKASFEKMTAYLRCISREGALSLADESMPGTA